MASTKWHPLPNRQRWASIGALTGYFALFFVLERISGQIRAEENFATAADGQTIEALTDRKSKLHRATQDELRLWIEQLGSPHFSVREQAVHRLSRCDATAIQTLRKASDESTDLEVKSRCAAIANAIYELDIGKRTNEFLKDPDPEKTYGFEGWIPFSELAGKSRLSKRLFAMLIESHPDQASSDEETVTERAAHAQQDALGILNKFRSGQAIELGDSISLLYRSIRNDGDVPASVDQITTLLLRSTPFTGEISRPPMRTTLQKIVGSWMKTTKSDPTSVLMIAIDNDIPESIEFARRAVSNRDCDPSLFLIATSALMRFGSQDDLAILDPWRAEKKLLQKSIPVQIKGPMPIPSPNPNEKPPALEMGPSLMVRPPVEIQLYELRYQDLALAASAHLAKREDMRELFPRIQPHPTYVYRPDSLAFPEGDDEARQKLIEALAKEPPTKPAK